MNETLGIVIEMNECIWNLFKKALNDLTLDEINWRPLPQANHINSIVRHLRIEAEWHLNSLKNGAPMPVDATVEQSKIDAVPMDFAPNFRELEELFKQFMAVLRKTSLEALQQHTELAYQGFPSERPAHLLSFHQAVHLAEHYGQICSIRNLYRRTRGEPSRFFPDNVTFPKSQSIESAQDQTK